MGMMRLLASSFLTAAFIAPASAATFAVVDAPGAGTGTGQGTQAFGINSSGDVTGGYIDSSGAFHAFIRASDGTFTTFDVKGGQAAGYGIGEKGGVSGIYIDTNTGKCRAFLRTTNGHFKTFDPANDAGTSCLYDPGINTRNWVAGDFTGTDGHIHAFERSPNGTLSQLDAPGATDTLAWSINRADVIAGTYIDGSGHHGYLRSANNSYTKFDAPGAAGFGTVAAQINADNFIVGDYSDSSGVIHGYVRSSTGSFATFDAPDAGTGSGQGTGGEGGINKAGSVAGVYTDSANVRHGYIRLSNGTLTEFDPAGSVATYAWDINNGNLVAGYYLDASGVNHGFIRTP